MPPTETGLLINSPLLGSTKLAIAEAMKKIDPIMFNQAIHQGKERGRKLSKRPNARMANRLATRNSVDPKKSGRQTRRSCCWTVTLCNERRERADIEKDRAGKLRNGRQPVAIMWQPRPESNRRPRVLRVGVDLGHRRCLGLQKLGE